MTRSGPCAGERAARSSRRSKFRRRRRTRAPSRRLRLRASVAQGASARRAATMSSPASSRQRGAGTLRNIRQNEGLDRGRGGRLENAGRPTRSNRRRGRGVAKEAHAQPVVTVGVELVAPVERADEGLHRPGARERGLRPMAHGAVQTTASERSSRISQSVQTWCLARGAREGPRHHVDVVGIDPWPSAAGSVITGVETAETDERACRTPTPAERAGEQDDEGDAFQDRGILCRRTRRQEFRRIRRTA